MFVSKHVLSMDIAQGTYGLRVCLSFAYKSVSLIVEKVDSLQLVRDADSTRVFIYPQLAASLVFSPLQPVRHVGVETGAFHGHSSRCLSPACLLVIHR